MHPDYHYIQSLLDNDFRGIKAIYANFAARIERLICSNSGSTDDARDMMQEALLAITRQARRPGFQLTCPFEAFLYLVCQRKWFNELKRRRRAAVTIAANERFEEETEEANALADTLLREEARDRLFQHFFEKLAADCRQLIRLSWSGLSMEEVSQQLGMTYGYARKRKSVCVARLMQWIQTAPEFALLKTG